MPLGVCIEAPLLGFGFSRMAAFGYLRHNFEEERV